jgi:hypothetical protein
MRAFWGEGNLPGDPFGGDLLRPRCVEPVR